MSVSRLCLASTILAMAAGCADDYTSVLIVQNQSLGEDCVISSSLSETGVSHGTLDVNASDSYTFTPVMQSSLEGGGGVENANIITMQGANVTLLPVNNTASRDAVAAVRSAGLDKLNQRFAGSLMPGGTLGVGFTILDPAQVAILAPIAAGGNIELIARVVAYGDVEGGYIESKPFDYPITLCAGCLVSNIGACTRSGFADDGALCFLGQNGRAECCNSSTGGVICPAVKE